MHSRLKPGPVIAAEQVWQRATLSQNWISVPSIIVESQSHGNAEDAPEPALFQEPLELFLLPLAFRQMPLHPLSLPTMHASDATAPKKRTYAADEQSKTGGGGMGTEGNQIWG